MASMNSPLKTRLVGRRMPWNGHGSFLKQCTSEMSVPLRAWVFFEIRGEHVTNSWRHLGSFSKQCTSEMTWTLQTSTVYFSRVSCLFECNANDTYVLRMTHIASSGFLAAEALIDLRSNAPWWHLLSLPRTYSSRLIPLQLLVNYDKVMRI